MISIHQASAVLLLRVFLGIIFFWQGFDKIFRVKVSEEIKLFEHPLMEKHFPKILLVVASYFTSYIEMLGGFLLIIGFVKYHVLALLGLDLLMVSFAFSLLNPVWDLQQVFVRLVLIVALLLLPSQWDIFSLDYLITVKSY